MKRVIALFAAVAALIGLCACTASAPKVQEIEGTPQDIVEKIYQTVELDDAEVKDWLTSGLAFTEITKENMSYYFGVDDVDITEGTASEPKMTSQAFSLCVFRLAENADINAAMQNVKSHVDPNKWVCVGVESSDVQVVNIGSTIMLVMAENSDAYVKAFEALVA